MYSNYYKIILINYILVIINNVNFELLRKPIVVISNGVTPTVYYWLNTKIGNVVNPTKIKKTDLYNFNTIILVRYVPFKIFLDLINLKRKSKKIVLLIDDNLLDLNIFSELPFLYKLKILFNIYLYKFIFNIFINEIWVTNKKLGEKVKKKISNSQININILQKGERKSA